MLGRCSASLSPDLIWVFCWATVGLPLSQYFRYLIGSPVSFSIFLYLSLSLSFSLFISLSLYFSFRRYTARQPKRSYSTSLFLLCFIIFALSALLRRVVLFSLFMSLLAIVGYISETGYFCKFSVIFQEPIFFNQVTSFCRQLTTHR